METLTHLSTSSIDRFLSQLLNVSALNQQPPSNRQQRTHRHYKLNTVRKQMEQKVDSFISGNNTGKVLNLQVPAGAGKSYITTKVINHLFPSGSSDIVWFGSMHDQFNDLGTLRDTNWVHIRGRSGVTKSGQVNCRYYKEAKMLHDRGISIPKTLCAWWCKDSGQCDYWRQLRKKGHKFLPHQMLFFYDGSKAPLVVFDELDPRVFLESYVLDANELVRLARAENKDFWEAFLNLLISNKELAGKDLYSALKPHFKVNSYKELKTHISGLTFKKSKITELSEAHKFPLFGTGRVIQDVMCSELDRIIKHKNFNPRIYANPVKHNDNQVKLEITIRRDPPAWLKDKPIILLGAKGDKNQLRKVLGKNKKDFRTYTPQIKLSDKVEVLKETKEILPASTLKIPFNRTSVCDEVKGHIMIPGRTALICHKNYESNFAKLLRLKKTRYDGEGKVRGNYGDTCHFWAIRGLNAWKDYDQIIIVGTPTPNIDDMARQVEALYWDEKRLDKTQSMTNGVHDYNDPRLSGYLHSLREDELYQAAFRIRPLTLNSRNKVRIIILRHYRLKI